jgi:hypothetical protein
MVLSGSSRRCAPASGGGDCAVKTVAALNLSVYPCFEHSIGLTLAVLDEGACALELCFALPESHPAAHRAGRIEEMIFEPAAEGLAAGRQGEEL